VESNIYFRDRETGVTERLQLNDAGSVIALESLSISADGRFVAFSSAASNLVPGDTNHKADVFVHDRQTGTTQRVSVASDGTQGGGKSGWDAAISADGRFVVFGSTDFHLAPQARMPADMALELPTGNLVRAWHFDHTTQEWTVYERGIPSINSLKELVLGQEYWIKVHKDQSVALNGKRRNLVAGWNRITW
jgi:hypothetical protein